MAINSSGTIGINTLRSEFQRGNGNLSAYTSNDTDPFIGTIRFGSADMRLSHYHGASIRTARLTVGRTGTTDGFHRLGFSQAGGSDFYYPEANSQTGAFGGITRQNNLSTAGTITGIHATKYGNQDGYHVTISTNAVNNNSGWTQVSFRNSLYGTNVLTRLGALDFRVSNVGSGIWNWTWSGLIDSAPGRIFNAFIASYNSANTQPTTIKFE